MSSSIVDDIKKFKELLEKTSQPLNESQVIQLPEALAGVAGDVIGMDEDDLEQVAGDVIDEADMSAVNTIRPLYQQVQGLVPSFKDPIRGHLLQAQKSLLAAVEAAEGGQVTEDHIDNS